MAELQVEITPNFNPCGGYCDTTVPDDISSFLLLVDAASFGGTQQFMLSPKQVGENLPRSILKDKIRVLVIQLHTEKACSRWESTSEKPYNLPLQHVPN